MRPEPKKRIDTKAGESSRPTLNAAFAGLDLPNLPAAPAPEPASAGKGGLPVGKGGLPAGKSPSPPAQEKLWKLGRVILRRETAHRGGKTVIVVHYFATHLPPSVIDTAAKKIRSACGCGGTIKDRTIEVQGDQPAKIRAVLEAEGFQVVGVR
jgi:translation initiation factor 1